MAVMLKKSPMWISSEKFSQKIGIDVLSLVMDSGNNPLDIIADVNEFIFLNKKELQVQALKISNDLDTLEWALANQGM